VSKRLANKNVRSRVIRALRRAGLETDEGGPHTVVFDPRHPERYATIPRHRRIKPALLRAIIKQCGLTVRQYLELYR
jgi:predicted RNA binding protein YcfA (HicA-like mRNA interferase family)